MRPTQGGLFEPRSSAAKEVGGGRIPNVERVWRDEVEARRANSSHLKNCRLAQFAGIPHPRRLPGLWRAEDSVDGVGKGISQPGRRWFDLERERDTTLTTIAFDPACRTCRGRPAWPFCSLSFAGSFTALTPAAADLGFARVRVRCSTGS